jgi:GT2 family glycosyltransferase
VALLAFTHLFGRLVQVSKTLTGSATDLFHLKRADSKSVTSISKVKSSPITARPPPVTIVVPVYGDLPTLTSCIESLKQNVDLKRNCVLLVNDCGPDADVIEESVLSQIESCGSIRYERNERNLGFVGTCNRAVTELDTTDNDILLLNSDTVTTPGFLEEMSAVLHLSPHHGVVSARSNNAFFASFPFAVRNPSSRQEFARTAAVHAALFGTIRRYTIAPRGQGFCFLIRRELITQHGLFDDVFTPGYFEESDFCLRMKEFGYSSMLANHAIVFHFGSRSFEGVMDPSLMSTHEKLFHQRHPSYWGAYQNYLFRDRDPVDVFADALVPGDAVRRVLVDIGVIPVGGLPAATGALLTALQEASDPKHLVTSLSIPDDQGDAIALQYPALEVIHHSQLQWLERLWDVAVVPADTVSRNQLIRLNWVSPRWVFISTGTGVERTWRKRVANLLSKTFAHDGIVHANGVIALGTGVIAELESYAGSAIRHLSAGSVIELDGIKADPIVQEIIERYGRSTIDIERLRARWDHFARLRCYTRESLVRRLIRRIEYTAPRPVGYAKGVARKVHGW